MDVESDDSSDISEGNEGNGTHILSMGANNCLLPKKEERKAMKYFTSIAITAPSSSLVLEVEPRSEGTPKKVPRTFNCQA